MTNAELQRLLDLAVVDLKQTTVGFSKVSGYPADRFAATKWGQGFARIAQARAALDTAPVPTSEPVPTSTPPPPPPSSGLELGAQFHGMWGMYTDVQRGQMLDKLKAAGATWVRIDQGWRWLEPARGTIDGRLGQVAGMAAQRGLKVLVNVILPTPAWTNAAELGPPPNLGDWRNMLTSVAGRLKGTVHAYELLNEPNIASRAYFTGTVQDFVAMLREGYAGVKAGDPAAVVVSGGLAGLHFSYLRSMYQAGLKQGLTHDALGVHPYNSPNNAGPAAPEDPGYPTADWGYKHVSLPIIRQIQQQNGDSAPVWLTELGWSSHNQAGVPSYHAPITEGTQAEFLKGSVTLVRQWPWIAKWFWYNERNKTTGGYYEDNFGLVRSDLTDKPALAALRTAAG